MAEKDDKISPQDKSPTTAEILLQIVKENVHLFHDEYNTAWGRVWGRCIPIRSTQFRRWLEGRFYNRAGKPPNSQAFNDSLNVIESQALYKGLKVSVNVRLSSFEDKIYIDLADETGLAIEVSKNGCSTSPTNFITYFWRSSGMKPLPIPETDGSIDLLRKFVNVKDDSDFRLMVAWLLAAYNPSIACPILNLQGEQGSAKSTTTKVLRSLVDPNEAPIRSQPTDERDIVIMAKNSRILAFDNLSGLKASMSDAFCRVCTGGGFSTRKLYTNDEEQIFKFKRPIILNGIDDIATRGDLLDRSIVLNLPTITPGQRKDERVFWKEFEAVRPKIIGQLLIGVAHGLVGVDKVKLKELPRMADFAEWITACEAAFWDEGTLLNDYLNNREQAVETGIESDIVATAVREIVSEFKEWKGTPTELVNKIAAVSTDVSDRYLPTTRTLKSRLTRISPALRQIGITWGKGRTGSERYYWLRNSKNNASFASRSVNSMNSNNLEDDATVTERDGTDTKRHESVIQKQSSLHLNGNYDGNDDNDTNNHKNLSDIAPF